MKSEKQNIYCGNTFSCKYLEISQELITFADSL